MKKQITLESVVITFKPVAAALADLNLVPVLLTGTTYLVEGDSTALATLHTLLKAEKLPFTNYRAVPSLEAFEGCSIKEDTKLVSVYVALGKTFSSNAQARQYIKNLKITL